MQSPDGMHPVPVTAEPPILAHLRGLEGPAPSPTLLLVDLACAAAEKPPPAHLDTGSTHSCAPAAAGDRKVPPSEILRPQSSGCSPPARPDELPLKVLQVLVSLLGASDMPGLAAAASQSRDPNVCPSSPSGAQALVAPKRQMPALSPAGYGHDLPLRVREQMESHTDLLYRAFLPSDRNDPHSLRQTRSCLCRT